MKRGGSRAIAGALDFARNLETPARPSKVQSARNETVTSEEEEEECKCPVEMYPIDLLASIMLIHTTQWPTGQYSAIPLGG